MNRFLCSLALTAAAAATSMAAGPDCRDPNYLDLPAEDAVIPGVAGPLDWSEPWSNDWDRVYYQVLRD